ncbi:MAG: NAD-dependent epimerase/dehydratase family protein [Chitinophagales bacterium]
MDAETILVTGACGQIGSELVMALRARGNNVIATDLKVPSGELLESGAFQRLDVLNKNSLATLVSKFKVNQIYHLAALLSATGEQNPELAWRVNMKGLRNILDCSVELGVKRLFFPSTIAVFGPTSPKQNTPQHCVMEPNTIYGISKQAGERWCDYYYQKRGLDVRSLRYPGLIGYKTKAGGGTTDYAVEIFFEAIKHKKYSCFLSENTVLPMMYMPDAIRGTIELMEVAASNLSIRSAYNFAAFSFSPKDLEKCITAEIPDFSMHYAPDFRQSIADSWPASIDDSFAQNDWGWKPEFTLEKMTKDMLSNIMRMDDIAI